MTSEGTILVSPPRGLSSTRSESERESRYGSRFGGECQRCAAVPDRLAPEISLVLLSHSPSTYLSLYPFARAHWGLKCPVYATQPTLEIGRVVCLEEAQDWRAEVRVGGGGDGRVHDAREGEMRAMEGADHGDEVPGGDEGEGKEKEVHQGPLRGPFVCTVDEINEAFNWVKSVRYSQPIVLSGESPRIPRHAIKKSDGSGCKAYYRTSC